MPYPLSPAFRRLLLFIFVALLPLAAHLFWVPFKQISLTFSADQLERTIHPDDWWVLSWCTGRSACGGDCIQLDCLASTLWCAWPQVDPSTPADETPGSTGRFCEVALIQHLLAYSAGLLPGYFQLFFQPFDNPDRFHFLAIYLEFEYHPANWVLLLLLLASLALEHLLTVSCTKDLYLNQLAHPGGWLPFTDSLESLLAAGIGFFLHICAFSSILPLCACYFHCEFLFRYSTLLLALLALECSGLFALSTSHFCATFENILHWISTYIWHGTLFFLVILQFLWLLLHHWVTSTLQLAKLALEWVIHSLWFLLSAWWHHFYSGLGARRSPGPKSGHSQRFSLLRLLFFAGLLGITSMSLEGSGGEGCILQPQGDAEVAREWILSLQESATKPCGMRPTMCYGTPMVHGTYTKVVKRCLIRACRRAFDLGCKGSWMQFDDFPSSAQQTVRAAHPTDVKSAPEYQVQTQRVHLAGKRLKIATWNPGGLAVGRFDELRKWLDIQQVDLAVIPETRWQYTNEWQDSGWSYVHSGSSVDKGSGVLCMVSRRLQKLQQIKWCEILPGRLLHLRLQFAHRAADIICCYQHTNAYTAQRQRERQAWWTCLDDYIRKLPHRNMQIVAGDFNCSLGFLKAHTGCSTYTWQGAQQAGPAHKDMGAFASLLRDHGLIALNSFSATTGPSDVKGTHHSKIDFILVKRTFADGAVRQTQHLWSAPFLPLQQDGHAVILGHIPFNWHHSNNSALGTGITAHQRQCGRDAWTGQTDEWTTFMHASMTALHNQMHQVPASDPSVINQMHETMLLERLPYQFIRENISIFADDMHIAGIYHSEQELDALNCAIGIFLDTLRAFELVVNPAKSVVILAMRGTSYRKAWQTLTTRDHTGLWVKIKMPHGDVTLFPVVKSTKYLGTIVSYGPLEDQTLKHRLQMARISFHRLHKWLCTKR
eukprot:s1590_g12.t1